VRPVRSPLLAAVAAAAAVALAAPLGAASAQISPFSFGFPPVGGYQIGSAGCVGSYSLGGESGSTSAQTCGSLLAFTGPAVGQIASVVGPTMIGSPGSIVVVSAGPVNAGVP
jgi:hypothetical protein